MGDDLLDLSLLLEVLEATAGERAVDLESVDEGSDGHETVGLNILVELVGSGLVKDDSVLGLVLDCWLSKKNRQVSLYVFAFCPCRISLYRFSQSDIVFQGEQ